MAICFKNNYTFAIGTHISKKYYHTRVNLMINQKKEEPPPIALKYIQ